MKEQLSIFDHQPGFKTGGTSEQAAKEIASHAETLRAKVLAEIKRQRGTADQIAKRLGETGYSVRPRCSELFKKGLIYDTRLRFKNESGKWAICWGAL